MTNRLAIYAPTGIVSKSNDVFGKDVANLKLFQALAQHGEFEELGVLTNVVQQSPDAVSHTLLQGRPSSTRLWSDVILRTSAALRAGAILRGLPNLSDLAWLRDRAGHEAYSLLGLVHTLAPPATREQIAHLATAPMQPWDALICPSPAVQNAVCQLYAERNDYIASRFQGKAPPAPQFPLIPLGVDAEALATLADRDDVRIKARERLGINAKDCLVLWVGRLSFFEKAYPQPMFIALQEARARVEARIHFVMLGWFPNGDNDRRLYGEAARAYAPDVTLHMLDGNDQTLVGEMWAASDIFLSLVDNIQETFGLTPLEAMAAGRPIVASDWDGYRSTVRDGLDGVLIPTLLAPEGAGTLMSARHVIGMDSYQTYVGTVAQFTAVDIERTAEALATLIADPDLRRKMGEAGRNRVRTTFDWPIVARQVAALVQDLASIRARAGHDPAARNNGLNTNRSDPFAQFSNFAAATLSPDTKIRLRTSRWSDDRPILSKVRLDRFGEMWRLNDQECSRLLGRLSDGQSYQVRDLLNMVETDQRTAASLALVWMCKLGILSSE